MRRACLGVVGFYVHSHQTWLSQAENLQADG